MQWLSETLKNKDMKNHTLTFSTEELILIEHALRSVKDLQKVYSDLSYNIGDKHSQTVWLSGEELVNSTINLANVIDSNISL